ncbi:MAG: MBOAT family O-acyltransferase, partial [Planctomycetota bacterium]
MLFNSYIFWAFLAVVLVLYRVLPHAWQNRMLLVASYVFYGSWNWHYTWLSWNWRYTWLMLTATAINFFAALVIQDSSSPRRRKFALTTAIVASLSLLAVFKYFNFFTAEAAALLTAIGLPVAMPTLKILLPVGISFYTFHTTSYTIDVYRREFHATRSFADFALFVSFFPQLVAGPIGRAGQLLHQVTNPRPRRSEDFSTGLYLVLSGLFRKIVIADNMANLANAVFSVDPSQLTGMECLVGVYAFAFQIYGDFSGYTAIAQGVGKWMGFDLAENFRMPYLALTPADFWSRWHISLSTWLRDYLYIPLGGNRGGTWKTFRNLLITMVLGGLWHGASWTFVAWGFYHGLLLCLFRPFERRRHAEGKSAARAWPVVFLQRVLMFHLVCLGW